MLGHDIDSHGRVLAGPGTGKSETVLRLARALKQAHGQESVHVITFTRAATAELTMKAVSDGGDAMEPTTLHSFCLSMLMRNPGLTDLPEPLRMPDEWETKKLIRPDIARRLRQRGFSAVRTITVRDLETEMSSRWESLDPDRVALGAVEPALRDAYLAVWAGHRRAFGYSLFAEIPLMASDLIQNHGNSGNQNLRLLIVDEYQNLNRCEIGLLAHLGLNGVGHTSVRTILDVYGHPYEGLDRAAAD